MPRCQKYCIITYDENKKVIHIRCMACLKCTFRRIPNNKPRCIRCNGTKGRIFKSNEMFDKLFGDD